QPLHSSTAVSASRPAGDAGGNSFSITGQWSNLHSLWDAGGGYLTNSLFRPLSPTDQTTLNAKVPAAEAAYPYTPHSGTIPNPMDWAQEGLGLAQTVSYVGITQGAAPSSNYLSSAQATTAQRLALGGDRLADLLNTIFGSAPISLVPSRLTNGKFSFSWTAIPGRTYRVQWKQQLTDPAWSDLTNIIPSTNTASFTEP